MGAAILRERQRDVMRGTRSWGFRSPFSLSCDKDKEGRQRQLIVFKYVKPSHEILNEWPPSLFKFDEEQ